MRCTCRSPARCPVCNTVIRVPLSNLESSSGAAVLVDRFARRDSASREGLRRLIDGWAPCPGCGNTVTHSHSRSCVALALGEVGVPLSEREAILAKITFPEA